MFELSEKERLVLLNLLYCVQLGGHDEATEIAYQLIDKLLSGLNENLIRPEITLEFAGGVDSFMLNLKNVSLD